MATGLSQSKAAVFVVDDDAAIRDALTALFESVGLQVKTFASTQEFLQTKFPDCPSCLVLDVRLPGMSGLDFQSELLKADVQVPIIFMTGHGDIPMTVRAMKAGAVEFLSKPFRDQDMLDAVQLAHAKDRRRRELDQSTSRLRSDFDTLTPREKEIMKLVASGLMNKQIAGKIGLSEITVKVHRGSLMRKLGAKSLADLIRMAEMLGVTHSEA
jgi:FixJ family two-component response regulator